LFTPKKSFTRTAEGNKKYADKIIIKTADSKERFQDELTAFLKGIKENMDNGCYLFSKVKKEYALNLDGKTIMIVDDDHRNVLSWQRLLKITEPTS